MTVDPDWKEAAAPPPPALNTSGLLPVDMRGSVLRWGVDPASISVGTDGVVRYVVVAQSDSGTVNAIYEGLRCNTAESTVYARHSGGQWAPAPDREWKAHPRQRGTAAHPGDRARRRLPGPGPERLAGADRARPGRTGRHPVPTRTALTRPALQRVRTRLVRWIISGSAM